MYYGEQFHRPRIGLKPTPADHNFVRTLSIMGNTVRQICDRLGDRFKLGKPMSRLSLYNHFRQDLTRHVRGRKKMNPVQDVKSTMQKMIEQAGSKRPKEKKKQPRPCKKCGTIFTTKVCLNCNRIGVARRRAAAKQANG